MRKIVYDKVDISIPNGQTNANVYETLREGTCIGVKIIPFTNATPAHAINIGVEDAQSNELVSVVDFRDFNHQGGGYLEGLKPVNLRLRGRVNVIAQASQAVAADFNCQVIFAIDVSNCED